MRALFLTEASELAAAKMKGLDRPGPVVSKPPKDVNSFINNQIKFAGGATAIPPEHMKCNILKAKMEEELKKCKYKYRCLLNLANVLLKFAFVSACLFIT